MNKVCVTTLRIFNFKCLTSQLKRRHSQKFSIVQAGRSMNGPSGVNFTNILRKTLSVQILKAQLKKTDNCIFGAFGIWGRKSFT